MATTLLTSPELIMMIRVVEVRDQRWVMIHWELAKVFMTLMTVKELETEFKIENLNV